MALQLEREVRRVVQNGNCSGCGGCAVLSSRVTMGLDDQGFLRPAVSHLDGDRRSDADEAQQFRRVCPGYALRPAVPAGALRDPTFGTYVAAWEGWATDDSTRHRGSSGGVLTALSAWLLASGRTGRVIGSRAAADPRRTETVQISTAADARALAGSRYAPTAAAATYRPQEESAFVGKPCEASAVRRLHQELAPNTAAPIVLSFFCAGTPSQRATDRLLRESGLEGRITELRYRGHGWPGTFRARDESGRETERSYEESWGSYLGRDLQDRCKLCPDGTGQDADVSVGDFWRTDQRGFPEFTDGAGSSIVLARTERGARLLIEAQQDGVIALQPVDVAAGARVQPLQRARRRLLSGRLLGRLFAGYRIPRYRGYGLLRAAFANPSENLKAARGMYSRSSKRTTNR